MVLYVNFVSSVMLYIYRNIGTEVQSSIVKLKNFEKLVIVLRCLSQSENIWRPWPQLWNSHQVSNCLYNAHKVIQVNFIDQISCFADMRPIVCNDIVLFDALVTRLITSCYHEEYHDMIWLPSNMMMRRNVNKFALNLTSCLSAVSFFSYYGCMAGRRRWKYKHDYCVIILRTARLVGDSSLISFRVSSWLSTGLSVNVQFINALPFVCWKQPSTIVIPTTGWRTRKVGYLADHSKRNFSYSCSAVNRLRDHSKLIEKDQTKQCRHFPVLVVTQTSENCWICFHWRPIASCTPYIAAANQRKRVVGHGSANTKLD